MMQWSGLLASELLQTYEPREMVVALRCRHNSLELDASQMRLQFRCVGLELRADVGHALLTDRHVAAQHEILQRRVSRSETHAVHCLEHWQAQIRYGSRAVDPLFALLGLVDLLNHESVSQQTIDL